MNFKEKTFLTAVADTIQVTNPLKIRLVVVKTLNYLDVNELKKCRQVCKIWNKIASFALSEKTEFDCRKMDIKDIDGTLEALAKDLCLLPQNFVYSFNSQQQTCRKFMKYYGHRLLGLRLRPWNNCDIFSREDLVSVFFQCPYLKSLSLSALPENLTNSTYLFSKQNFNEKYDIFFPNMMTLTLYGGPNYCVDFLCNILSTMPNLSKFIIQQPYKKFLDQIFWVLKIPKYNLSKLKIFQILRPLEFNNEHLIRLELCTFHLKVFHLSHIQMINNTIGKTYLEPLLQTLSFTLEELTLPSFGYENDVEIFSTLINIPKMLNLKKLKLEDWKLFGSLEFVKNSFPNLSILVIEDPNKRRNEISIANNLCPQMNLIELSLPFGFNDGEALQEILKGFPKLKKLKLFVNNYIMNIIYMYGKDLEELHMYSTSLATDTGITGISKKNCEELRKGNFKMDLLANRLNKAKYSISDLQNLRRLSVACCMKNLITHVSIMYGISDLKNLNNLCFRNCTMTDFSLVALSQLPLLQLDLGSLDGSTVSHIGLCYFQNQKPFSVLRYIEC